ncbi:hypothetical protein K9M74_05085 [Candidatus Woesearchaeota archaeon]|nr:hypothetical protein [Candidatus Woesearchaeota archaeon]
MNEDYATETNHPYKNQIQNIRTMYQYNIEPQVTDEDFHEQFYQSLDELDFMLEDSSKREIQLAIQGQLRILTTYDSTHLIRDEYQTIIDDLKSKTATNNNKEFYLRKQRDHKK